ncbi:MAG: UDP-N-acetylmuramoyl-tripeptide--D-alanyl-D-alanine ligase, partial [Vicinamibacterales bacterium]|nr:UDP-N-acetylmuramoyl-tripeptide--D-alanyl-D-alanine ligase [Vicinamibacterales bacterium]
MTAAITPAGAVAVALTPAIVAEAAGGAVVRGDRARRLDGCSIDSRTLAPGDLFVAIVGDRFDGHTFVRSALAAGASAVVVSDLSAVPAEAGEVAVIQVPDTTRALQDLAWYVRRASGTTVVGITGSAGKTTTKELTADLLALGGNVFRSQGNFNNHIGLPLSLLELRRGYPTAVVELGMNHAGELRVLTAIAEPDVRVWTNVAEVHSEFFASIDAIADAKAELLDGATPATLVVANAADPLVMARVGRCPARVVTFGVDVDADVSARHVHDLGTRGTRATVVTAAGSVALDLPLVGRGHLANALAAAAVALQFGLSLDVIALRLGQARPAHRRGAVHTLRDGVVLVDDSYNSNPQALMRMLEALKATPAGRRVAVLGEMLELGEQAMAL